jgi:hypothetical protein
MLMNVRRSGLALFVGALACGLLLAIAAYKYDLLRWKLVLLAVAVPVALSFAGLAQVIAGVPFSQLASKWNALTGWQRGVLGLVLVAVFCVVLFSGVLALISSGLV